MKPKVVVLDASQVDAIVKYSGFEGLSAVVKRGDYFFFSEDTHTELRNGAWYKGDNRAAFDAWIADLRQDGRILRVDPVLPDEEDIYDPNGKRHTKRGGAERWDMSARKFMALNPDYDFEVISRDKDFYENRNRAKWNADAGTHARIVDTDFRFTTMKKLMGELVVDPDLNLSEEQFMNIRDKWQEGFGDAKGFRQGTLAFPESYKQAQILQETARLRRIGGRFSKLARKGAPVAVLGLAAVPVISMVQARAEERNVSFVQAAGELGLEFTEDDLKSLAADVGVDLAVTLTPVGALKKAWDVLGNIDDIVALTQLYGEAYPENRAIQEMAGIARDVERSDAFATYVGGRDAMVGVVGSAIDRVFGNSSGDAEIGQKLNGLRSAINHPDGAFARGVEEDASADLLTGSLTSMTVAGNEQTAVPLTNWPSIAGSDPILPSGFSTGGGPETEVAPGMPIPSGKADALATGFEGVREQAPAGDTGKDLGRKTSYDRYRQLGATPEEEAEALRDFNALHEESLLQMGGDREAAASLAVERFAQTWDTSAFAPEADGIVIKHPAENVYPDLDRDGHGYLTKAVQAHLASHGIDAARWYLSPNENTGRDWRKGWTDEAGYGPRMTLSYDDDQGVRHLLSETFQARISKTGTAITRKPDRIPAHQMTQTGGGERADTAATH